MPHFVRVRDKSTGHELDVSARTLEQFPDRYSKVNAAKAYPDLTGPTARPRPVKYRTDKAGQPATTAEES